MTQFSTLEAELAACSDASQVRRLERGELGHLLLCYLSQDLSMLAQFFT